MGTLTIRLDDKLDRELTRLAKQQKRTKSELVRDILRRYTTVELFDEARKRLQPYAERAGYLTDEDFFREFS
ncbi:MAG: ribbon-helix-helix protein, CopG family [Betaproteobacteria bacterium]|nr:ribbon-helix-helix protein, CopG family [Betaproteobacteria bacterium]